MDKDTRNRIQRATQDARALLEREYGEQLEGVFDIRLDGTINLESGGHLDAAQRVLRTKLVAAVDHVRAGGIQTREAVTGYLRESSFTTLNRFVALKMLEARGLVQECIGRGDQSAGFKEFAGLAPGLVELADHGYRLYIDSIFDEIGREVRVLFDRRDPASLLWPRRQALQDMLAILNSAELAEVWEQDETIGWVYQYFNGDDERKKMRDPKQGGSQAPRNSRELAVRNQFFTPRYVVEFLTDNTLGRIWYEMRQGNSRLVDECGYLVRRPNELFLREGEEPPVDTAHDEDLNQQGVLRLPVRVPFRAKKDPRDLKILDPACGSGHFLLYAFDLLVSIYEEAWADNDRVVSELTGCRLRDDYAELHDLRRAMPGLVLRHNLHGIDIDPRATQIAALALWMRAQRAYSDFSLPRPQRPLIAKTNIVVAEPMPGESDLRREFASSLEQQLGQLVQHVFEKMDLAGEAGALLRIEDDIRDAIRRIYGAHGQLFEGPDRDRWRTAESELIEALHRYAEQMQNGQTYQRRLFAEDAARGFAFISLCRERYDVVLMNPPFGDAATPALEILDKQLASSGRDIGAAFVREAAERWAPSGTTGVLLSAATWFQPVFERWREDLFFGAQARLRLSAHLGGQVLDGATVSASPIVIGAQGASQTPVLRLRHADDLASSLQQRTVDIGRGKAGGSTYFVDPGESSFLPGRPFSYWASRDFRQRVSALPSFEGAGGTVKQGTATADEPRFARAWWEVPADSDRWVPYMKSSEYSPYWDDVTWVGKFGDSLHEVDATGKARVQATDYFGTPGVTFPSRSVLGFNPRLHPPGCAFSHTGSVVFGHETDALSLLGFLGSRPTEYLISLFLGDLQGRKGVHPNHYEVGTIQRLPWPALDDKQCSTLRESAIAAVAAVQFLQSRDETARTFVSPLVDPTVGISDNCLLFEDLERKALQRLIASRNAADAVVANAYGFAASDTEAMAEAFGLRIPPASGKWRLYFGESGSDISVEEQAKRTVSWLMGIGFGRWARAAAAEHSSQISTGGSTGALLETPPATSPAMSGERTEMLEVMVDDPGHGRDVLRTISQLVGASGLAITTEGLFHEAATILGVRSGDLRDWLRSGFFKDHVKRYSKSRRKAPIYWQLASASGDYSVWLYYLRLTKDTFYKVLNDYVTPKLRHEERRLAAVAQNAGGNPTTGQRSEIMAQEARVDDVRTFLAEVARIAPLWNPDLSDGVIINFAPLWRLVPQHRDWQKTCKKAWDRIAAGDCDWTHLAMHLWPERVVPKCTKDRSLAVAHGLEDDLWLENGDGKWQPRKVDQATVDKLINDRSSTAVKDALKNLLDAPAPVRGRGTRRRTRTKRTRSGSARKAPAVSPNTNGAAQKSGRRTGGEILEQVTQAIAANGDSMSKADVIDATGISARQWSNAIKTLLADGTVIQTGERRGARYHLAAVEQQDAEP